jgi:hypothetical protein
MAIRDGKRAVNSIRARLDELHREIVDQARTRARAHGTRFAFPECEMGYDPDDPRSPDLWGREMVFWQLSLLLGEYMAGLLAQKAAEGHCNKHRPCPKMAKNHMDMLDALKADLQGLVRQIDEVQEEIRQATDHLQKPSQRVAQTIGLRNEQPDDGS